MTMHDRTTAPTDPLAAHRREMDLLLERLEEQLDEARELVREFKTIRDSNRSAYREMTSVRIDHEDA